MGVEPRRLRLRLLPEHGPCLGVHARKEELRSERPSPLTSAGAPSPCRRALRRCVSLLVWTRLPARTFLRWAQHFGFVLLPSHCSVGSPRPFSQLHAEAIHGPPPASIYHHYGGDVKETVTYYTTGATASLQRRLALPSPLLFQHADHAAFPPFPPHAAFPSSPRQVWATPSSTRLCSPTWASATSSSPTTRVSPALTRSRRTLFTPTTRYAHCGVAREPRATQRAASAYDAHLSCPCPSLRETSPSATPTSTPFSTLPARPPCPTSRASPPVRQFSGLSCRSP